MIRGATPHFDLVVSEAARGVGALAAEGRIAVAFGVLACDTVEQASSERTSDRGQPGRRTRRMVAVEMADLYADMARSSAAALAPVPDLPRRGK